MPDGAAGIRFGSKAFRIKRDGGDAPSSPCRGRRAWRGGGWHPRWGLFASSPVPGANAWMHPVFEEMQQSPSP